MYIYMSTIFTQGRGDEYVASCTLMSREETANNLAVSTSHTTPEGARQRLVGALKEMGQPADEDPENPSGEITEAEGAPIGLRVGSHQAFKLVLVGDTESPRGLDSLEFIPLGEEQDATDREPRFPLYIEEADNPLSDDAGGEVTFHDMDELQRWAREHLAYYLILKA